MHTYLYLLCCASFLLYISKGFLRWYHLLYSLGVFPIILIRDPYTSVKYYTVNTLWKSHRNFLSFHSNTLRKLENARYKEKNVFV
jgi:hypothetical protein